MYRNTTVSLSARERAIIAGLAEGAGMAQIATRLGISPHTVKTYLDYARVKLKARSASALVHAADHMAALASGLNSLARTAGHHLAHGSAPHHIAIQYDTALLFNTPAGNGTCLAVLATHHDTDPALIHHHMTALVTSVHPHLTTPGRAQPVSGQS